MAYHKKSNIHSSFRKNYNVTLSHISCFSQFFLEHHFKEMKVPLKNERKTIQLLDNHSATTIYFDRQASLVKWIECTLLILIDVLGSNPTADAKRVPLMLGLTLTSDILKDRGWFIDKTTGEFRPLTSGPYDMW